jgi:DNA N-6-adenine-methyltransferase (Dam)
MASIAPPAHTRSKKTTDDWITPKFLLNRLTNDGQKMFDLDPCACMTQPWPCATKSYTKSDDGLLRVWIGEVWLNPPYGKLAARWLKRLAEHGNGVALIFARTDTKMFFEHIWFKASALLFIKGRMTFNRGDGSAPKMGHNSGGPSVLIAYGEDSTKRLKSVSDLGAFVLRGAFP